MTVEGLDMGNSAKFNAPGKAPWAGPWVAGPRFTGRKDQQLVKFDGPEQRLKISFAETSVPCR